MTPELFIVILLAALTIGGLTLTVAMLAMYRQFRRNEKYIAYLMQRMAWAEERIGKGEAE